MAFKCASGSRHYLNSIISLTTGLVLLVTLSTPMRASGMHPLHEQYKITVGEADLVVSCLIFHVIEIRK